MLVPLLTEAADVITCYYMDPIELKVARIGNSRGVRLPAATLDRYHIGETVLMEEREDGILLRPGGAAGLRLSWAETAIAMSLAQENWGEWDQAANDGIAQLTWDPQVERRVAEPSSNYKARRRSK